MKRVLSILLAVLLMTALCPTAAAVPEENAAAEETLRALGIMTPDAEGEMRLSDPVTRAEFSKMLTQASAGRGETAGSPGVSPYRDVGSGHWAAGTIRQASDAGWMRGYADGTFRPGGVVTAETAAAAALRLLGYTEEELSGGASAQLKLFRDAGLGDGVAASAGQTLTRGDCVRLFYNLLCAQTKDGSRYAATLGLAVTESGEPDLGSLISDTMEGPFLVKDGAWTALLPFPASRAVLFRDGKPAEMGQVSAYDVLYYHDTLETVWAYSTKVTGLYTLALPDLSSPRSVTVAGNTYSVGTSSAAWRLSSSGVFQYGDTVTLLLGRDGAAVFALSAGEVWDTSYGVVTGAVKESYTDAAGNVHQTDSVTVACTDGTVGAYEIDSGYFEAGDLISVDFEGGVVKVARLPGSSVQGRVSSDGTRLGGYAFSKDAELLDTSGAGQFRRIWPIRLADADLERGDVRFCQFDGEGKIRRLILNDATGDLETYGIVTGVREYSAGMSLSGTYDYLIGTTAFSATQALNYNVSKGPAVLSRSGSTLTGMRNLEGVRLSSLNGLYGEAGEEKYRVSEEVLVYLCRNGGYDLTGLSTVSDTGQYSLFGYFDSGHGAGGLLRIILATERS